MVGILPYNTHIKTLSNLNTTCNCLVLYVSINPYLFWNQKVFFYILIFSSLVPLLIICNHSFEITDLSNLENIPYGTHWRCKRLIGLLLLFSIKCISVGQNSVELTATKYDPKNWFGKSQDERETSSITFVINFRKNKKLNFGLHQCR